MYPLRSGEEGMVWESTNWTTAASGRTAWLTSRSSRHGLNAGGDRMLRYISESRARSLPTPRPELPASSAGTQVQRLLLWHDAPRSSAYALGVTMCCSCYGEKLRKHRWTAQLCARGPH
ncbi:hypothetical protein GY45DRAFT_656171 [Cubamyces sp. BRFM 1775]|nr:hypothetical protein GY45DRAFT_656171 [Cubamyces sp. BRFM 1775]